MALDHENPLKTVRIIALQDGPADKLHRQLCALATEPATICTLIAIAPRLFARIDGWGDARLRLPDGFPATLRNVLATNDVEADRGALRLADMLSPFPVALLLA